LRDLDLPRLGLELATSDTRGVTVRNRKAQSALLVAGAAAGAAAAAWLGKRRHLTAVDTSREHMVEPERAELPVGRSADPAIDEALSRSWSAHDETSGAALLTDDEPRSQRRFGDMSLDDVWNAMPGFSEGEQSEGYDAVSPEDMGAVWLERATQTTHEGNPHASDPNDLPPLDQLAVRYEDELDDQDEDEIEKDDLDA
jgi:hypothetical protein